MEFDVITFCCDGLIIFIKRLDMQILRKNEKNDRIMMIMMMMVVVGVDDTLYRSPGSWKRAFPRVHSRLFVQRRNDIYTHPRRDQSRDRILLRGSLTRSYAGIEKAVHCTYIGISG